MEQTAVELINSLGGRQPVAASVGVTISAVRMAESAGKIPAQWFAALERLAGRDLPRELFTFK